MAAQLLLRRERDREVAGAPADARRAAHGARAEALERGALVGVRGEDAQVVADQLVVVLRVGYGGLQQLAPVVRDGARRVREDRARLRHRLAAYVVAHEARLARGRAHVLRLRAHDGPLALGLGCALLGLRGRRRLVGGTATPARAARAALGLLG